MGQQNKFWYYEGFTRGKSIAENVVFDYPEEQITNELLEVCHDVESNDRQFSPFEHIAKILNEAGDSEACWESFDEGIEDGIADVISGD